MITLQIDGIEVKAQYGTMIIEAAEAAGIRIPRFCYHKKLSTAANCRMCLVEVDKTPKLVPACTTTVGPGMKVSTKSPKVINAQRGVMEFLLINHPLDCPICDQGGECPLQEMAMGFGAGISRYRGLEKRIVGNPNLGPLVSTDMTRCIHCTRCLRFTKEIAGTIDLGGIGRGEHMAISNYVSRALTSELSGNIIDLCPVGALTAKPSRYNFRPWELTPHASIGPHDSLGSHLRLDTKGNKVMRVVAAECEEINEIWLSDRDRFSYQGLYNERLLKPRLKGEEGWKEVDWPTALEFVAKKLIQVRDEYSPEALGALLAPTATLEECYLLQKLVRTLGSNNIDHRLRQLDFSTQELDRPFPGLNASIEELEQAEACLIVGSNLRKEHPLINQRLRKALFHGSRVMFLDVVRRNYNYPATATLTAPPSAWASELIAIAKAALGDKPAPTALAAWSEVEPQVEHHIIAEHFEHSGAPIILLGNLAQAHPQFATLRAAAELLAEITGARLGFLPEGAGTVGAWLTGCVPHRGPGGKAPSNDQPAGRDWRTMLSDGKVKGLLLLGAELERDCADPVAAFRGLSGMELVVSLSPWISSAQERYSNVMLPIAAYAETAGTYANMEGKLQSFQGAAPPVGEARPAWKVIRALGNLLNLSGFEQVSVDQVLAEAEGAIGELPPPSGSFIKPDLKQSFEVGLELIGEVPPYKIDALVRRASALQETPDGQVAIVARINPTTLSGCGLAGASRIKISQEEGAVLELSVAADDRVAEGCVVIPVAVPETASLGPTWSKITLAAGAANG